jgi:predicted phosphodiesterase
MGSTGDWDIVCCGHSHSPAIERIPSVSGTETLLLNPGTIGGVGQAPATYMLVDLASMNLEILEVDKRLEQGTLPMTGS